MDEMKDQSKKWPRKTRNLVLIAVALIVMGSGTGIGLLKASEKPAFCSYCHIIKPYYNSWNEGDLLAHKHAEHDVTCHDCHQESVSDKISEGVKYLTGDYETPLNRREFGTREFCLSCHDFEKVKSATNFEESNPHDNHNGDQECNLCHNMHRESQVMCAQCHQFEWMDDLGKGWK
ncbi:MAG TPA: cytochrome c3 [Syntrophothermus lipocalidus]|uniref:Tetrahaem cytochrome domain-containing protein n=1 Tax=Syntrophothermus lipocalidus (strain DSM 12680 / TGB-C1) TaxID=643648 RepID=D7CJB8_SYNLT|nr:cytochrome c3 [Syntrophothermus lipocalidus]ADI01007.1 conserved hypothetical protein [Syntrophothermus lipocalidus DSM 12680]HHV77683.1 cytochrome c3 [Syntrophothermus lipocalidus]